MSEVNFYIDLSPVEMVEGLIKEFEATVRGIHRGFNTQDCKPGCHRHQLENWLGKLADLQDALAEGRVNERRNVL